MTAALVVDSISMFGAATAFAESGVTDESTPAPRGQTSANDSGLLGPHDKYINGLVREIDRLGFATEWQAENAKRLVKQIAKENISPDHANEYLHQVNSDFASWVNRFRERTRHYDIDLQYTHRPAEVRELLRRVARALRRPKLTPDEQARLARQIERMKTRIKTFSETQMSHEAMLKEFDEDIADTMSPAYDVPLTTMNTWMNSAVGSPQSGSVAESARDDWFRNAYTA